jgi:hypothetical protein
MRWPRGLAEQPMSRAIVGLWGIRLSTTQVVNNLIRKIILRRCHLRQYTLKTVLYGMFTVRSITEAKLVSPSALLLSTFELCPNAPKIIWIGIQIQWVATIGWFPCRRFVPAIALGWWPR